ncbi:MAG TPA: OPT/YSL family transporter [Candidatus Saccharimonadales bacterium]|nr:OPT/YSL family transporter [Candidatus Saccharimonadales bacterium]
MANTENHHDVLFVPKPPDAPEFTWRAVLVGLLVAAVIGGSYPYVVLKLGFGPNISVVSAFFGYILLGIIAGIGGLFSRGSFGSNRWQNNMVQAAGTAAGQTAFLCVLMAAFDMLEMEPGLGFTFHLTPLQSFLWLTTAGILGVLLAVPMRRHFVVDEKLTYADGVAAGETLIVLDSQGPQAARSTASMLAGLVVSAVTMLCTQKYIQVILEGLRRLLAHVVTGLRAATWGNLASTQGLFRDMLPINFNRFSKITGVGLTMSWLNLGSGMIVGMRINANMVAGLLLSWVVAPPLLARYGVISTANLHKTDILLWVMWPATGVLVAGGLAALFLRWRIMVKTFKGLTGAQVESSDFPLTWVGIGVVLSTVALIAVQSLGLRLAVWQTLVAVVCTLPLMLVGLRVLGETNWGPISTLSNLMQGVFGFIAPGSVQANMVASGVTGTVASESEGIMQVYKTGQMIGSSPRYLTYMNLLAIPVGAAAVAVMYPLLRNTWGIGGDTGLQSPISQRWVGFAILLSKGVSTLHPSAMWALLIGAGLGIVFTGLEQNRKIRTWVPSPTGLGIGMLVPAGAVATMFLGGVVEWTWRKLHPDSAEKYVIPVASGFIAGEALVAVILPILIAVKVLQP